MGKRHALVLPVFPHAHFVGIYRLALFLAKSGVTITFVGLGRQIALLKTYEELQGLDFNLVSYEDYGSKDFVSVGVVPLDIITFLSQSKANFRPILDELVAAKKAGLPAPTCIVADRFLPWAIDASKELGIPYYQFWSCGATFARALQGQIPLFANGTLTIKRGPDDSPYIGPFEGHVTIPGLPPLEHREVIKPHPMDTKMVMDFQGIGNNVNNADAVILNTFYELEAPQIDALRQSWKDSSLKRIPKLYLIGPMSEAATFKDRSEVEDMTGSGTDCLRWLDGRQPVSVIYVCFGTVARLLPPQVEEVALALEASEQSFLWVVSQSVAGLIPPGFQARTKEQGLVVSGWVPQSRILQHSAIGGFLTHCGWNTILECITSGVPMAAWPLMPNDQFLNARHAVDVLKIAVGVRNEDTAVSRASNGEAKMSTSTGPKNYGRIEEAVRLLLSEEGNALRARVEVLKKKAEAVVKDHEGASNIAMNEFAKSIPS